MATTPLQRLLKRPSFTSKDAKALGIHPSRLAYYANQGTIERVARGLYRNPNIESTAPVEWQELLETAQSIPGGVICGVSALRYYDLTQEMPRKHWIAVPNTVRAPKRPNAKIIRPRNLTLGREILKLGEYSTFIFDRERSVLDAFKLLSRESALRSLRIYLNPSNGPKPDFRKLVKYAKALRVNIEQYLEAMQFDE